MEARRRSFAKTASWRLIATAITFLIIWLFSDKITFAGWLAVLINGMKAICYYWHERIWARRKYGYETPAVGERQYKTHPVNTANSEEASSTVEYR